MAARGTPDSQADASESSSQDDESPRTEGPAATEPFADEPDPVVGQLLGGRYRVIERLAAGGMGTVYRAEHIGLRKEVAIKLVNEEAGARPDHALRFLREAMLTSRIDHPNVISATDYGTFEDGTAFLAMTLVSGPTLSSVMEAERPMHWVRAAEIGAQIADAIAAAQVQGIVHRDLKPENLVLEPMADGTQVVKVLDFGIAKYARDSLAPPSARGAQQATRVGVVVGTPGYMAPEQAVGKRTDHRADLYALGVLLWECVVGRKLWEFDDIQQLMAAQLNQAPPSVRRASADASIPDAFDSLVASLLATRPENRPESAVQARDSLRALVASAREGSAQAPVVHTPTLQLVPAPPAATPTREIPTVAFRRRASQLEGGESPATAAVPEAAAETTPALAQPSAITPSSSDEVARWNLPTVPIEYAPPAGPGAGTPSRAAGDPLFLPTRRLRPVLWVGALLGIAGLGLTFWSEADEPAGERHPHAAAREVQRAPQVQVAPSAAAALLATTKVAPTAPAPPIALPPTLAAPADPKSTGAGPSKRSLSSPAPKTSDAASTSADELRASARKAFGKGDFQAAARAYSLATKKAPEHAGGHAGLGASQLALGDAREAIASYRRAIQLSPSSSGFHAALGRAYFVAGERPRAIASYRKAVALDPTNQAAFAALAQLER